MSRSPEEVVVAFCDAWQRGDLDELMSWFADDAVYHNIPVPPVAGAENIRRAFASFAGLMDSIELIMLNIAASGDVVFTERIDRFRWDGKVLDLPVAGVFEVRDGRITAHRDYFNYSTWLDATGISLAQAPAE